MELNGCYRTKVNCKAFVSPILTARLADAFRIGIANGLQLTFVL